MAMIVKNIRLTEDEVERLELMAADRGVSRAAIVREIIDDFLGDQLPIEPYVTRVVPFSIDPGDMLLAEEKAGAMSMKVRDVVRAFLSTR